MRRGNSVSEQVVMLFSEGYCVSLAPNAMAYMALPENLLQYFNCSMDATKSYKPKFAYKEGVIYSPKIIYDVGIMGKINDKIEQGKCNLMSERTIYFNLTEKIVTLLNMSVPKATVTNSHAVGGAGAAAAGEAAGGAGASGAGNHSTRTVDAGAWTWQNSVMRARFSGEYKSLCI